MFSFKDKEKEKKLIDGFNRMFENLATLQGRWIKRCLKRNNVYYKFLTSRGYNVDAERHCLYKISNSTQIDVILNNGTVAVVIYPVMGNAPVLDLRQRAEGKFLLETYRKCAMKYNDQGIYYYNHGVTRQLSIQEKP